MGVRDTNVALFSIVLLLLLGPGAQLQRDHVPSGRPDNAAWHRSGRWRKAREQANGSAPGRDFNVVSKDAGPE
jgi:hypothetical protein